MALVIAMRNVSELAPVSNYEIDVYINEHRIAGPFRLEGHRREDGWQALVKQWAETLKPQKYGSRLARSAGRLPAE